MEAGMPNPPEGGALQGCSALLPGALDDMGIGRTVDYAMAELPEPHQSAQALRIHPPAKAEAHYYRRLESRIAIAACPKSTHNTKPGMGQADNLTRTWRCT